MVLENGVTGVNRTHESTYSVPKAAGVLFKEQILNKSLVSKYLPKDIQRTASKIRFLGRDEPTLPVNWRIAESAAALHALEAACIGLLLEQKYNVESPVFEINTEHAQLFPMSLFRWTIDPHGDNIAATMKASNLKKYIVDADPYRRASTPHRAACTNLYKCSDGKFFQTHGSLNPDIVQDAIELPRDAKASNSDEAWPLYQEKISKLNSQDLLKTVKQVGAAGDICRSVDEFLSSEDGQAIAHFGLFEIQQVANAHQRPCWWPPSPDTSAARPLAGLKVVDLTRIIAGPSVTRGLAELGASVMRVMGPDVPDFVGLHIDLNWGKWNTYIDLQSEQGRTQLRDLIKDADVVVNGYRPGVLDKYGFSQTDIVDMVADRDRGIISVRENCYGWYGPSKDRPGWQPVSDACVGISHSYGRALGMNDDEPVTALIPNSDYSTGTIGVVAVLCALLQRAESGGSHKIDLALNYYNQWLARSVGTYPDDVWQEMWERYGRFKFRSYQPMEVSAPIVMKLMQERSDSFRDEFFETRRSKALGVDIRCVKPVINVSGGEVELRYNVGTRGNGTDAPHWPPDLRTEFVS